MKSKKIKTSRFVLMLILSLCSCAVVPCTPCQLHLFADFCLQCFCQPPILAKTNCVCAGWFSAFWLIDEYDTADQRIKLGTGGNQGGAPHMLDGINKDGSTGVADEFLPHANYTNPLDAASMGNVSALTYLILIHAGPVRQVVIENLLSELDDLNEWYFDHGSRYALLRVAIDVDNWMQSALFLPEWNWQFNRASRCCDTTKLDKHPGRRRRSSCRPSDNPTSQKHHNSWHRVT